MCEYSTAWQAWSSWLPLLSPFPPILVFGKPVFHEGRSSVSTSFSTCLVYSRRRILGTPLKFGTFRPSRGGSRHPEDLTILPKDAGCLLKCPECAERNTSWMCVHTWLWALDMWPSPSTLSLRTCSGLHARHEYKNKRLCPSPDPRSLLSSPVLSAPLHLPHSLSFFPEEKFWPIITLSSLQGSFTVDPDTRAWEPM